MNPIEALGCIESLVEDSDILEVLDDENLTKEQLVAQLRLSFGKIKSGVEKFAHDADKEIDLDGTGECFCEATADLELETFDLYVDSCPLHDNAEGKEELVKLLSVLLDELEELIPNAKTTYPYYQYWDVLRANS